MRCSRCDTKKKHTVTDHHKVFVHSVVWKDGGPSNNSWVAEYKIITDVKLCRKCFIHGLEMVLDWSKVEEKHD